MSLSKVGKSLAGIRSLAAFGRGPSTTRVVLPKGGGRGMVIGGCCVKRVLLRMEIGPRPTTPSSSSFQSTLTNDSKPVAGKVDKTNQRVAWRIGDNGKTIYETTRANLTEEVSPIAIHFDSTRTQTWLLVRMPEPAPAGQAQRLPVAPKAPPPLKVAKD